MKTSFIPLFLATCIAMLGFSRDLLAQDQDHWLQIYDKAPVIAVKEPSGVIKGSLPEGLDVIHIHLTDLAKYIGHVCGGVASGYIMTDRMLQELYPNDIPVRGDIRIVASDIADPLLVASYITGAVYHGHGEADVIMDPSVGTGVAGDVVMIFQRKDTGRMVRGIFHKFKLVPLKTVKRIQGLVHDKIPNGAASDEELQFVRENVQAFVSKALLEMPDGVLEIIEEREYQFK